MSKLLEKRRDLELSKDLSEILFLTSLIIDFECLIFSAVNGLFFEPSISVPSLKKINDLFFFKKNIHLVTF